MANDIEDTIDRALSAAKAGDRGSSRTLLSQAVKADPKNPRAWYLLSQLVETQDQAIFCLNQLLKIDPNNAQAKERLAKIAPASSTSKPPAQSPPDLTLKDISARASVLQSYYNELVAGFKTLQTFEDTANWKADAGALIVLFDQYRASLETFSEQQEQEFQRAKQEREALPALKRLTASQETEKEHRKNIDTAHKGIESVDRVIADLVDRVERIPTTKAEQKQLLADLRLYKKELELEKRQANESMRQIRTQARQKSLTWTGIRSNKSFIGTMARVQRRSIRVDKEVKLAPHESVKTTLEKLIIETERKILWVSHFTGGDFEIAPQVFRCSYCGRKMGENGVCPGCGSDHGTWDLS